MGRPATPLPAELSATSACPLARGRTSRLSGRSGTRHAEVSGYPHFRVSSYQAAPECLASPVALDSCDFAMLFCAPFTQFRSWHHLCNHSMRCEPVFDADRVGNDTQLAHQDTGPLECCVIFQQYAALYPLAYAAGVAQCVVRFAC